MDGAIIPQFLPATLQRRSRGRLPVRLISRTMEPGKSLKGSPA